MLLEKWASASNNRDAYHQKSQTWRCFRGTEHLCVCLVAGEAHGGVALPAQLSPLGRWKNREPTVFSNVLEASQQLTSKVEVAREIAENFLTNDKLIK
jgi:hypothetical protein